MIDKDALRLKAESNKEILRKKLENSRREAIEKKKLRENPPPVYTQLPSSTGNAEVDSLADLTEVQAGFRKRALDESNRFALATDSEYWTCICFQTREQKEYFLNALNILQFGERYLDGQEVAKQLGITLPKADVPYKANVKPDPVWIEFT